MVGVMLNASCGHTAGSQTDTASAIGQADAYHADNDIAMTVRSITDAIRVGEPLDTADYNFEGILTDGEGRPIYIDMSGAPGLWDIDVLSPTKVVIRNLAVGDLLPEDLESYLLANLGLSHENYIDSLGYRSPSGAESAVYDFEGGYLRIDVHDSRSATGLEGAMVSITASRELAD